MIKVLDIPLYDFDLSTATQTVVNDIVKEEPRVCKLISATGAHGIITAQKDEQFKKILSEFYINLPDGMPGVWVGKLKGAKDMERCYGPDFFKSVIMATANNPVKHFLCGGKPGVANKLKETCENKFHNHHVIGTYCPPFREMSDEEMKSLGEEINRTGAQIVWIGLSSPKQERFAYRLRNYANVNFIVTIGAAFDFHTGGVRQAPRWIQKIGMEWFFRMMTEPKRLGKRYLEIVPLFIYYNLKEATKTFLKKDSINNKN